MGKQHLDREACRNVLVVVITPRREDRQVDLEGIRKNVRYLIQHGVDFIMPECGTGMVYDASLEEYEAVVGTFLDEAGDAAYVVPGI
jgi:dihydrodipicolinate synthase/N-acetylneuraminate lyase